VATFTAIIGPAYGQCGSSNGGSTASYSANIGAISGSLLYGDFGTAGLWMYNGTAWSEFSPSKSEEHGHALSDRTVTIAQGQGLGIT